jgi:hypothetical protein
MLLLAAKVGLPFRSFGYKSDFIISEYDILRKASPAFCNPPRMHYLCPQIHKSRTRKVMEYNFKEIEKKWQAKWIADKTYEVKVNENKPKRYVLDMFPYPSGAGLHVGHPLGYIASDIYSRF